MTSSAVDSHKDRQTDKTEGPGQIGPGPINVVVAAWTHGDAARKRNHKNNDWLNLF